MIAAARLAALLVAWGLIAGCAGSGHLPLPPEGAAAVTPETALGFQARAEAFYQRLLRRRFNALETFNDPQLRQHFQTEDLFYDYYATLATSLDEAHFEKSRPSAVRIEEFVFESPSVVWVQVRFTGLDDRPLRPDRVAWIQRDRWERADADWWLTPGKL